MRSERYSWREETDESFGDAEDAGDPLRPSARQVLIKATVLAYEYLSLTLIGSLAVFLFALALWTLVPPGIFGHSALLQIARLGALLPFLYVLMSGPVYVASKTPFRQAPSPLELLYGVKRWGLAAIRLGLFVSVIGVIISGDLALFLSMKNSLARWLALPFFYFFLIWMMVQLYAFPLLIEGLDVAKALRQSLLITLDNPVFTATLTLACSIPVLIGALLWMPVGLIAPVWIAWVQVLAVETLKRKYNALEALVV